MKVEDSSEPWYQALQNDILILNYEKFFFYLVSIMYFTVLSHSLLFLSLVLSLFFVILILA